MEALGTQITIPASPDNLRVITALAAEDPEIREAMLKDGQLGKRFGGGYVSPTATKALKVLSFRHEPMRKRITSPFDDTNENSTHTPVMNDITRDELRSTLSEIESRMDRRIDRLADEFRNEMALRAEADQREAVARSEAVQAHLTATKEMTGRLERDFLEVISATKAQKYWLAGIGIAVVLGIMGANATIFSGGKAFFDGGVDHAAVKQLLEETKSQTQETRALLESLKNQQAISVPPHPPAEGNKQ
ncbi:hypothetical protein [Stutzerimonas nitrititolerans]|uniref:Uncharacterized protein n=1 Tax=Stutzerimonas nitrititolerans TaxID=2482751 RepID=A0AA42BEU1_9GAMM|nr:hypothetical protein [Stutzerimonas nitrititolerans]MCO7546145.1 hypothetical protein [Stutzerimonas nitrititolerans]